MCWRPVSYTHLDNIAFGLKVKKVKKSEIDQKVRQIAKKVDLTDEQLAKAVSQLSGGQQQRVAIARALVTGPAIICMDEPLSNLDAKLRVQLRNELKKMQKDFGITTIYVTHDQEEALTLSDRIAVFNKGVIEQIGTPNEVYNHSQTEFVCNSIGAVSYTHLDVYKRQPYTSPNADAIAPKYDLGNGLWTPFSALTTVLIYNTKLVRQNAPTGWNSLLDRAWQGRIAFADPTASGSGYTCLLYTSRCV